MHKHYCPVVGHEWKCKDPNCECICGLRMDEGDHNDCPIELRACPEHPEGSEDMTAEPAGDAVQIDFSSVSPEQQSKVPQCKCGCAELDAMQIVGWCMWCSHVYADWNLAIQNEHFAHYCPGAPEQEKRDALASLETRKR